MSSTTEQLRTTLLLKYPQFKPKFTNPSQEYTDEITKIELFIEDAKLECDLVIFGTSWDKAIILLTCHYLTIALPQGHTTGQITWEERQADIGKTVTKYTQDTNSLDFSTTKYGKEFLAIKNSLFGDIFFV